MAFRIILGPSLQENAQFPTA